MICRDKRLTSRIISMNEFRKEKEDKYKWFQIEYHEYGNVLKITKEFQKKEYVERYLDNPLVQDCRITVLELVDDG